MVDKMIMGFDNFRMAIRDVIEVAKNRKICKLVKSTHTLYNETLMEILWKADLKTVELIKDEVVFARAMTPCKSREEYSKWIMENYKNLFTKVDNG